MSHRLCIVEDDRSLRETLRDAFTLDGYEVEVAADGSEAMKVLFSRHFDLILLDVMLPGMGGFEILRELRSERVATPVLMLTVKNEENDKVLGFELGADDYVTKPFSLRELKARVKALVRRTRDESSSRTTGLGRFEISGATIDLERFEITRDGEAVTLSPREAGMLRLLFEASGRPVTRDDFLREVWGGDAPVSHRTVDTHVLNLRHKVETDHTEPKHLLTVHGVGYRLVVEP